MFMPIETISNLSKYLNTPTHKHPIKLIRRYLTGWFCSICSFTGDLDNPSYHCTLCDFDLCVKCAQKFIKEGKAKQLSSLKY